MKIIKIKGKISIYVYKFVLQKYIFSNTELFSQLNFTTEFCSRLQTVLSQIH